MNQFVTKRYTNGTKNIVVFRINETENSISYNAERNGKAFGRQFRMTFDRLVAEFWEVIEWEPTGETLDEIIKRDRG
jgi:hypothetical protein